MIRNMNSTFVWRQRAIDFDWKRHDQQSHDLVQPKSSIMINQVDFKPLLNQIQKWHHASLKKKSTKQPAYYTKRVDEIFERIGLGD